MKLLFICTHNRCRSILCEAITRHLAGDRIIAFSAGSQPAGQVHPLSLKYLQQRGVSIAGLQSQSWDDFENEQLDAVITVCDSAANESCPVWYADVAKAHWGLPDPSKLSATEEEIRAAFVSVMDTIESRIRTLLTLDFEGMSRSELEHALHELAKGTRVLSG